MTEEFSFLDTINCHKDALVGIATKRWEEALKNSNNRVYLESLNIPFEEEKASFRIDDGFVEIGRTGGVDKGVLKECLMRLKPWKKGPFRVFGEMVDAEWRSDIKWSRICHGLPDLRNKTILDIGSNNGYFIFRMQPSSPRIVLGIDPVVRVYAQFNFLQSFVGFPNLRMGLWGIEDLAYFGEAFDVVFSMGIIYHHRNPMEQLLAMRRVIKKGGTLVLETMGIPGEGTYCLFPQNRYAKMKNVWFVPTLDCFVNWVERAGFKNVRIVSSVALTTDEQRATTYSGPISLKDFLDPEDDGKTIEGYPAPMRFCLVGNRK